MTNDIRKHSQIQLKTEIVDQIVSVLQEIQFGSIEIIIHDGKVVQIERKEKLRFDTK
ncbi:MAG: putative small protein [Pseudomonadota bacterium]|jgi:hypothetical protein